MKDHAIEVLPFLACLFVVLLLSALPGITLWLPNPLYNNP